MTAGQGAFNLTRRQWLGGAATISAGGLTAAVPARAQSDGRWPNVSRLIAAYVDARKVANMVVTLGFGAEPPTVIAAGLDSLSAPRRSSGDSLYRIYSMTKPITGMAAMLLIDDGRLALDQPLHEILPRYRTMQVQKVHDGPITADNLEPAARPITIRHLLTHTAGIGYGVVQSGPVSEAYRDRGLVPGMVTRLQALPVFRGTPVRGLDTFADRLAELPLVFQPGTRWSYSMALDLLGRVIEVATGQAFDRFLQEKFFDPLGMTDTHFRVPRAKAERMTASYLLTDGVLLPIDLGSDSIYFDEPAFPFGGAGLVSTPRDYDRFLAMLLGGGVLQGVRIMTERAVRLGTSDLLPGTLAPGGDYDAAWGYGAGGGSAGATTRESMAGRGRPARSASFRRRMICAPASTPSTCRRWLIRCSTSFRPPSRPIWPRRAGHDADTGVYRPAARPGRSSAT